MDGKVTPLHVMNLHPAILHWLLRDCSSGAGIHALATVLAFGDEEIGKLSGLVLPEDPERARLGCRANAVRAGLRIALRVINRQSDAWHCSAFTSRVDI